MSTRFRHFCTNKKGSCAYREWASDIALMFRSFDDDRNVRSLQASYRSLSELEKLRKAAACGNAEVVEQIEREYPEWHRAANLVRARAGVRIVEPCDFYPAGQGACERDELAVARQWLRLLPSDRRFERCDLMWSIAERSGALALPEADAALRAILPPSVTAEDLRIMTQVAAHRGDGRALRVVSRRLRTVDDGLAEHDPRYAAELVESAAAGGSRAVWRHALRVRAPIRSTRCYSEQLERILSCATLSGKRGAVRRAIDYWRVAHPNVGFDMLHTRLSSMILSIVGCGSLRALAYAVACEPSAFLHLQDCIKPGHLLLSNCTDANIAEARQFTEFMLLFAPAPPPAGLRFALDTPVVTVRAAPPFIMRIRQALATYPKHA